MKALPACKELRRFGPIRVQDMGTIRVLIGALELAAGV